MISKFGPNKNKHKDGGNKYEKVPKRFKFKGGKQKNPKPWNFVVQKSRKPASQVVNAITYDWCNKPRFERKTMWVVRRKSKTI